MVNAVLWIRDESLHFNHIFIASFQIHGGRVQRQNYNKSFEYLWILLYVCPNLNPIIRLHIHTLPAVRGAQTALIISYEDGLDWWKLEITKKEQAVFAFPLRDGSVFIFWVDTPRDV